MLNSRQSGWFLIIQMVGMWWNNQFCSENQHLSSLAQIKEKNLKNWLTLIPVFSLEFYRGSDCHKLLRLATFKCKFLISLFDILQHRALWWAVMGLINYNSQLFPGRNKAWTMEGVISDIHHLPAELACHTEHCFPFWPESGRDTLIGPDPSRYWALIGGDHYIA